MLKIDKLLTEAFGEPLHESTARRTTRLTVGWHTTPSKNVSTMLKNGIKPISKGNIRGEFANDKTYFFTNLDAAMHDFAEVAHKDFTMIEIDLKGLSTFADPEDPANNGFTTDYISNDRIEVLTDDDFDLYRALVDSRK